MAGNKFRTFRNNEDSKELKKTDIEKDSNIIFKKNYEILTKAKEDEKYRSKEVVKEGTIKRVIDIIQNEDNTYIKILNKNNNIRYIALYDNKGNYIIQKYQSFENKEEKNNYNSKIETYHSIRLGDAKIENDQNNQKDPNYFQKPNELMNKMIKFAGPKKFKSVNHSQEISNSKNNSSNFYNKQNNNIEDKSDPFWLNDAFNQNNRSENKNKKEVKNDNNNKNLKLKEIESNSEIKQSKPTPDYYNQFYSISDKFCGNNTTQNYSNVNSLEKEYLVSLYLLKRELDRLDKEKKSKFELKNLPLEPKYEKGFQIIYRPIKIFRLSMNYFFEEKGLGHIFVRYYDKKRGIDKIIESIFKFSSYTNEIIFSDFKKEDLGIYNVIQDEELTGEENYYEMLTDILKKKYNKNGRLIRGTYALKDQCCFQTAEEVVIILGKSGEKIKELHEEKILPVDKFLDDVIKSYLENPIKFKF